MSQPVPGDRIRRKGGTHVMTVSEVFPAGMYPGMLCDWHDGERLRSQACTTRDFDHNWEILPKEQSHDE